MPVEDAAAEVVIDATVVRGGALREAIHIHGVYAAECHAVDGQLKWCDTIVNTVVTAGKNLALDTLLGGVAYTVVGPFMGLISAASFSAIAAADTMASHGGWLEAGVANAPLYTVPRKLCLFNAAAAGGKALSAALSFAIAGSGTIKGAFIVYGPNAVSTVDNTAGTLLSAGLFSGGDKVVGVGDTVNVSYTLSL